MSEDGSRDGGDGDNSSKIGEWRAIVTLIVFIITSMSIIHVNYTLNFLAYTGVLEM